MMREKSGESSQIAGLAILLLDGLLIRNEYLATVRICPPPSGSFGLIAYNLQRILMYAVANGPNRIGAITSFIGANNRMRSLLLVNGDNVFEHVAVRQFDLR
jgi:hypothetical protein